MMKSIVHVVVASIIVIVGAELRADTPKMDFAKIEEITKLKGKYNESEGVFKISLPRDDVPISVDKWKMPPFMGLTSWASFMGGQQAAAMVMGDLVLFEDEVEFRYERSSQ